MLPAGTKEEIGATRCMWRKGRVRGRHFSVNAEVTQKKAFSFKIMLALAVTLPALRRAPLQWEHP